MNYLASCWRRAIRYVSLRFLIEQLIYKCYVDQTACLLTYVTYFMAMHPEVTKRMREEVLRTHGSHQVPTYDSVHNLKYSECTPPSVPTTIHPIAVRAVLNETLRLFPPVPLNVRECRSEPCALPPSRQTAARYVPTPQEPLFVPARAIVMYFPLLMQRNPDLWGADADAFDPERWLDPRRVARLTANPLMFTPFSAGPRIVSAHRATHFSAY